MSKPKQAVVLIHGIGDQVPMDTLRGFVQAVWTTDEDLRNQYEPNTVWSKPDEISKSYELRRLTTARDRNDKRTDFFEFYWADLMSGTEVKHVVAWVKLLLLRSPFKVPKQLQGLWWTIMLLTIGVPIAILLWGLGVIQISGVAMSILSIVGTVVWAGASWLLTDVAGDAARYLHVSPANIARRRAIRDAGIELLTQLHKDDAYDRIILVGHSLGTVIGYDILTHLWPRVNRGWPSKAGVDDKNRDPLEVLADKPILTSVEYQPAQETFVKRFAPGNVWKITDFITMGSPLAHASFLLARSDEEFELKKREREIPTCPPTCEPKPIGGRFFYESGTKWVPHHGSPFAPTRWTNLYFPCEYTVFGDVIGGPVAPALGDGIEDVRVHTTINEYLFAHTGYWSFPKGWEDGDKTPSHVKALRRALRLSP